MKTTKEHTKGILVLLLVVIAMGVAGDIDHPEIRTAELSPKASSIRKYLPGDTP